MKNILAMVSLVLFFLPACKESKTKSKEKFIDDFKKEAPESKPDKENGHGEYTISAPKGWTKMDTIMMGHRITFLKSPAEDISDDFTENVNVVTEKTGNLNLDDYVDRNITSMENNLNTFEKKKISSKNINGLEFRSMQYSHIYSGIPIDVEVYFTIKTGTAYIITCSAKGGTISRWEPEFEEAIRSFKVN